jgi:hypothetical protein
LSKIVHCTAFSLWSESPTLPFVRFQVKQKVGNNLVDLLKEFFKYREPQHEGWKAAVADFSSSIPDSNAPHRAYLLASLFFRFRLGFAVLV